MIEQKTKSSVWSVAAFAVVLFIAAISFEGALSGNKSNVVSGNVTGNLLK